MTDRKHIVAVVGYGGMGSQHVKILQTVDRVKIAGIYDIAKDRQCVAQENMLAIYESLDHVLADENVDTVLIATPNDSHKDIAVKSLRAGKHVICEKPVTLNSEEFQVILDTAEECNRVFAVHQNRRWDEDFLVIKKLFNENALGEVISIEQRIHGSRGIPGDWRHEKKYGGGMMLDWGVHLLDRLTILVKEKITKVFCHMSYVLGNEVDDGFMMHLTFESGKTAIVEVGTSNYLSLPIWYMTGKNGAVIIEDWNMNGKVSMLTDPHDKDATPIEAGAGLTKTMAPRAENSVSEYSLPRIESDIREFYHNFIDTTEGKANLLVKNSEVMRVMKLMETAFESSALNKTIDFE